MKYFISVAVALLIVLSVNAQIKLPSQQTGTKSLPKQKAVDSKPAYTGPVFTLKAMSNVPCKFYVDGELIGVLNVEEIERINLKEGEYQFKAISAQNNTDVFKEFYTVTKDLLGSEKFYEIDFTQIVAERERKEAIERAAEKEAHEKAEAERLAAIKVAEEKAAMEKEQAERERKSREYEEDLKKKIGTSRYFEGKLTIEGRWENVPENMKPYYKKTIRTEFYKKDKFRMEMETTDIVKSIVIFDYAKSESLTLSEIKILDKVTKTATLQKITEVDINEQDITMEYFDEFKTIAGYNCQKVKYITNKIKEQKITESICYVITDFILSSGKNYFGNKNAVPYLMVESVFETEITDNTARYISSTISVSEQPVDDSLFSLIPPSDYTLTDKR